MRIGRIILITVGSVIASALIVVALRSTRPDHPEPPPADAGTHQATDVEDYPRPQPDHLDPRQALFRECAAEVGLRFVMRTLPNEQRETFKINLYDHGCGLAVGDFDGDGHDDLYFANQLGPNALYRNKGDGTFEDVTTKAGVALGDRVCVAATFVDYDNDGRQDLYVTSTRGGNVLFHNEGGGTFKDVTAQAGVGHVGHSQTAVFFDSDGDGLLDLYLTNTARWTTDDYERASHSFAGKGGFGAGDDQVILSEKEANVFYHNNGDGTFTDVTAKVGLQGRGWAGDAVAFDYNGDGRPDLFVTSMFGRCQLYRNDGGVFTDVTLDVLGRTPFGGTGAHVLDFDNDGRLDLFVVDMHSDMWMGLDPSHQSRPRALKSEKTKFRYFFGPNAEEDPLLIVNEKMLGQRVGFRSEEVLFGNAFYHSQGEGKFREISDRIGVETFWPWGIAEGDFDNDGYQDVFVPAGMGYPFYYWPNSLLMNTGTGAFRERAEAAGLEPPARGMVLPIAIAGRPAVRSSRCAATGDFDGDGRLDLVTNNFDDSPYFFRNQAPRKDYLAFRLRGTRSNRDAIGAVVRLRRSSQALTRQVQAAGGYLSQSSKTIHFGLGDRPDVEEVEILWPSGTRQVLHGPDVSINQVHDIVEPR
jgi:hypothetical protein